MNHPGTLWYLSSLHHSYPTLVKTQGGTRSGECATVQRTARNARLLPLTVKTSQWNREQTWSLRTDRSSPHRCHPALVKTQGWYGTGKRAIALRADRNALPLCQPVVKTYRLTRVWTVVLRAGWRDKSNLCHANRLWEPTVRLQRAVWSPKKLHHPGQHQRHVPRTSIPAEQPHHRQSDTTSNFSKVKPTHLNNLGGTR